MLTMLTIKPPNFMWFLPSNAAHLTDENPGPIEVNFAQLSKENQNLIILGIKNNQITADKTLNELMTINDPSKINQPEVRGMQYNEDEEHPMSLSEEDFKIAASSILNKVPITIKNNVSSSSNIRLLRIMLELEKNTRNRDNIVSCIEERLENLILSVHADIERKTIKGSKVPNYNNLDPLSDSMIVTESEEEKRIIELDTI